MGEDGRFQWVLGILRCLLFTLTQSQLCTLFDLVNICPHILLHITSTKSNTVQNNPCAFLSKSKSRIVFVPHPFYANTEIRKWMKNNNQKTKPTTTMTFQNWPSEKKNHLIFNNQQAFFYMNANLYSNRNGLRLEIENFK